jgi:hypothetical protein
LGPPAGLVTTVLFGVLTAVITSVQVWEAWSTSARQWEIDSTGLAFTFWAESEPEMANALTDADRMIRLLSSYPDARTQNANLSATHMQEYLKAARGAERVQVGLNQIYGCVEREACHRDTACTGFGATALNAQILYNTLVALIETKLRQVDSSLSAASQAGKSFISMCRRQ